MAAHWPYPRGVLGPTDEDGDIREDIVLFLGWRDGDIEVSFVVLNIGKASQEELQSRLTLLLNVHRLKHVEVSRPPGRYWADVSVMCPSEMLFREVARTCVQADVAIRRIAWDLHDPFEGFMLMATGQAERFLGARESVTIDAKAAHYTLVTERQKLEYAADLAAFANADDGGLILIGLATKKDAFGSDVIDELVGCKAISGQIDKYYSVADNLIIPSIRNLRIEAFEIDSLHIVAILVPPQRIDSKPFLLKGALIDGEKVSTSAFSVPVRTGDRKKFLTAETIQSMLSATYKADNA